MDPKDPNPAPVLPHNVQRARRQAKSRAKGIAKSMARKRAQTAAKHQPATQEQLEEMEARLLSGWMPSKVCDHYAKFWNLPYATLFHWVRQIEAKWLEDSKNQGRDARHEWIIRQMQHYIEFARNLAEGEHPNYELMKCVPNMMERLARATGTYQASEVKVQVSGGIQVGEMSDDAVKNRIAELLAKHGHLLPGDPGDGRRKPKAGS